MSGTREATITALAGAQLTRHFGRPTRKAVKLTRKELGIHYAAAKTTHEDFLMGDRFGLAPAVITSKQFITAYNQVCAVGDELDPDWEFIIPTQPKTTDPTIDHNTSDTDRRRMVAEWKEHVEQWNRFDAYEQVFKSTVEAAYDSQYFDTLKDDLLGYTHVCVSEMLDHLLTQARAMTDVEKQEKFTAALKPWNQDQAIATFFHNLDRTQEELDEDDIDLTERQKIVHAVKQMYDSHCFDARDMRDWERKPDADKTWVHLQTYFNELYEDVKKYENATGRKHGFESAANVQEQAAVQEAAARAGLPVDDILQQQLGELAVAATADKEHIQQMTNATDDLLAVVKQQQEQITELMRQNGLLIAKLGTPAAAGSTRTAAGAAATTAAAAAKAAAGAARNAGAQGLKERGAGYTEAEKVAARALIKAINSGAKAVTTRGVCGICQKHYGAARCFEIDANKHLRPDNWKSLFA